MHAERPEEAFDAERQTRRDRVLVFLFCVFSCLFGAIFLFFLIRFNPRFEDPRYPRAILCFAEFIIVTKAYRFRLLIVFAGRGSNP